MKFRNFERKKIKLIYDRNLGRNTQKWDETHKNVGTQNTFLQPCEQSKFAEVPSVRFYLFPLAPSLYHQHLTN